MLRLTKVAKMKVEIDGIVSVVYTDLDLFKEETEKLTNGVYEPPYYGQNTPSFNTIDEAREYFDGGEITALDYVVTDYDGEGVAVYTYSKKGKFYCDEDRGAVSCGDYPV